MLCELTKALLQVACHEKRWSIRKRLEQFQVLHKALQVRGYAVPELLLIAVMRSKDKRQEERHVRSDEPSGMKFSGETVCSCLSSHMACSQLIHAPMSLLRMCHS
jgi:hypothetical protein